MANTTLFIGNMWSFKTHNLIEELKANKRAGEKVYAIDSGLNTRNSERDLVVKCKDSEIKVDFLDFAEKDNIRQNIKSSTVVGFDEIHLYSQDSAWMELFFNTFIHAEKHCKEIFLCSLSPSFKGKQFKSTMRIFPFCNKIVPSHSVKSCFLCSKNNPEFNMVRKGYESKGFVGDHYDVVCWKCYQEFNL